MTKETWDLLSRVAIIITIIWVPSIFILYFGMFNKIINILKKDKYSSKKIKWKVVFNYSKNNWIYIIGKNEQLFEIKLSKASDESIHIYNDPKSIKWVSIALNKYSFSEIKDVREFEMSSRVECPQTNEIAILKNIHWNYCVIKFINIKDRTRSDEVDEVTFKYIINSNWNTDFSD